MDPTGQILANRPRQNQVEALVTLVAPFGNDIRAAVESSCSTAALANELAPATVGRSTWPILGPAPA
jgi:hypothetical protein